MKKLFLIPARGASKGLPRKNILSLAGRPMIYYTLDAAQGTMNPGDELCVSTDDPEIMQVVEDYGIKIPFKRPAELASDTASSEDVIRHAIEWYQEKGKSFDVVVLLQPTSPLRKACHVKEALALWDENLDMVVSVKETDSNPYYVLFEEDDYGFLKKSKEGNFTRRQDCPKVWELNGAIYIINIKALKAKRLNKFQKVRKLEMYEDASIDVDTLIDWHLAELYLKQRKLSQDKE